MATDLSKLLRAQAQRQKQQAKKILAGDKGVQGRRRTPQAPTLTGLKNIQGEEEEVRAFFKNVDDDNIAVELQRFMNSKAVWKGRRTFFKRFMGLVPEEHYVHFKEHYLNQDLDFKQYFDTVYKPQFVDTDIFNSGKYDEVLRELFNRYLRLPPSQYQEYELQVMESIPGKVGRFIDMLNIFKLDIDDNEKRKFAQLFIENNLPFEHFYLKYMGGDFDVTEPRDSKVEEPKPRIQRKPLMIDEDGNIVQIPTHNLYKFEGPRNRLPILSREEFKKKIEEGAGGILNEVIELAKIELKTNLNIPNNDIDDIIIGLTEKYNKVNKFVLKLGEIIIYFVTNFVIKNQEQRIASLYRDRIENRLINFRNLAYAKKSDFLPELFQFKNAEEVSVNMVNNFIGRQLEVFLENFKNKLYVYITNVTAKVKNIHMGINNVVIVSDAEQTDPFVFGYTNSSGENVYFNIRNKPGDLPKKLAKRLAKVYSVRGAVSVSTAQAIGEEPDDDEHIDIEEIYESFVRSLDEIDVKVGSELGSEEGSELGSEEGSEVSEDFGSEVSSEQGSEVSSEERSDVGSEEGSEEGSDVGSEEGSEVSSGSEEGSDVGSSEGDIFEPESDVETKDKPSRGIFSSSEESDAEEAKAEVSESDSPDRLLSCKCIKCGSKASQNIKTKIKDGNEFKTVCFCSFKCFEKYKK